MRFWARPLVGLARCFPLTSGDDTVIEGESNGRAVYVLIDGGYKPGSAEQYGPSSIDDIVDDIHGDTASGIG
jgi:hypothetical protein